MPEITREYGIVTPDGQERYGFFVGRPMATEADRAALAATIKQFGGELGWPVEEFAARYKWTSRTITSDAIGYALDDPSVTQPPAPAAPSPNAIPDQLPSAEPIRATGE